MTDSVVLKSATKKLPSILSIVQSTIVKPSSPTPPELKHYNLSPRDIHTSDYYIPLVFFFPSPSTCDQTHSSLITKITSDNVSLHLQHSLSETLSEYYPFAGRLSNTETYIECNDQGVEFHEAHVKCSMAAILEKPSDFSDNNDDSLHLLFFPGSVWGEVNKSNSNPGPLMVVQLNRFDCGGLAVAVSLSHKIADIQGFSSFLTDWSVVSRKSSCERARPHFISWPRSEIFEDFFKSQPKNWITKKFVFHNSNLAKIKSMVTEHGLVENPTRLEIVTALFFRSVIAADDTDDSTFGNYLFIQSVEVRSILMVPPTSVGCFISLYLVLVRERGDVTLNALIKKMKEGKKKVREMEVKETDDGKIMASVPMKYFDNVKECYACTSLCNYPLDMVDFGWGKTVKVSLGDGSFKNFLGLIDTPDGDGIEATVCLDEQRMLRFERDEEILAATSSTCMRLFN